jgi:uncharacterized protein with HEPN domain
VSRDASLYICDTIEACRRVMRYTEGLDRAQLVSGTMAHDAVLRNLEVLGEAAENVPTAIRQLDDTISWRRLSGWRDVLAHAYFGSDDDVVWSVVVQEVPPLLPRLTSLRSRR